MITVEDQITIRNLKAKNPAISNRGIAKLLGISHNTVKSALKREGPPLYQRKKRVNAGLEPFHDLIFELANVKKYKGSRIYNEIVSKGYKGSRSPFYQYLSKIRIEEQKVYTSYETAPGEQAQFDWSPYTVQISQESVVVYIFSYINSFSRYQIYEASLSQDQGSVFEALENSLRECGGMCSRLQTDNAKAFVKNASRNNFQWNKHYLQFVNHYGFKPTVSRPRHPESKGKVEKPFQYLENHFMVDGNFEDFKDLQVKLKQFQKHVNHRVHSTIKTEPATLFQTEKPSLLALPDKRYISWRQEVRKLMSNCFLSFNGCRYSAPYIYSGKFVWVKVSRGYYLQIFNSANKMIAEHPISLIKGKIIFKEEHFKGFNREFPNYEHLSAMFLEQFPEYKIFTDKLYAQKKFNPRWHLARIWELSGMYSREDFKKALDIAILYNSFSITFISGYLEKNHKYTVEINNTENLSLPRGDTIRDLKEYSLTNNKMEAVEK